MAAATFATPKLKPYPVIPLVVEGAMAHSKPFVASPAIQQAIGFPAHGGDHDHHLVALLAGRDHAVRDRVDAVETADGGAAVFLDDERHDVLDA